MAATHSPLIDADALRQELTALTIASEGDGSSPYTRAKVLATVKARIQQGRAEAEMLLRNEWRRLRLRHSAVGYDG